jgi:hypothetical protein
MPRLACCASFLAMLLVSAPPVVGQSPSPPTPAQWLAPRIKLHDIELKGKLTSRGGRPANKSTRFELYEKREAGALMYRYVAEFSEGASPVSVHITTPDRVIRFDPKMNKTGAIFITGAQRKRWDRDAVEKSRSQEVADFLKSLPAIDPRRYESDFKLAKISAAPLGCASTFTSFSELAETALALRNAKAQAATPEGVITIKSQASSGDGAKYELTLDSKKDWFPLAIHSQGGAVTDGAGEKLEQSIAIVKSQPKEYKDAKGAPVWYPSKCEWGRLELDDKGNPKGKERILTVLEIESAKFNHDIPLSQFSYSAIPIDAFPVAIIGQTADVNERKELEGSRFVLQGQKIVSAKANP